MDVGKAFQGRRLSLLAVKSAVGIAHEFSNNGIVLFMVRHDGPSFWSTIAGALPEQEPTGLARNIKRLMQEREDELDPIATQGIEHIRLIAEQNPYAGWRALSQTDMRFGDGQYFKEIVFGRICSEENMVIPLGDPGTQRILGNYIGVLPNFRPSRDDARCSYIIRNLESHRTSNQCKP